MFDDDGAILPWLERLREPLPELQLYDAHTHIGENDPDGFTCTYAQLVGSLERADSRGVVFPMHEPDGYSTANDMVLDEAARSEGRLVAFCRLDPHSGDPVAEAERALGRGARGIKLHPRAEDFALTGPEVEGVFALADERRLPVLVHAGRGIPALGRHAVELCERYPGVRLILAHAGICDLAWIWKPARDLANLFFDTSWWSPDDHAALFTLVPPGQILFGSDAPYGTPMLGAVIALRAARQAGLDDDQVRAVAGGQVQRLLAAEEPLDLGPAPGDTAVARDLLLDRVHTFLINAAAQMLNGIKPVEGFALVRLACEVGEDAPQAEVCRAVIGLLDRAERSKPDRDRPSRFMPGLPLAILAASVVRSPDVPLVELEAPVGERSPG